MHERQAVGRDHQRAHQQEQHEDDGEHVGVGGPAPQVEGEQAQDRRDLHALQPVHPAGDGAVRRLVQEQADAQGDHQPREVAAAQHEETRDPAGDGAGARRSREADEGIPHAVDRQQAGGVGAEPEERGVPQRHDSGVAEDQVEREREQPGDQDLRGEQQVLRKEEVHRNQRDPESDFGRAPALRCRRCRTYEGAQQVGRHVRRQHHASLLRPSSRAGTAGAAPPWPRR